jgi:hypothetical protein
LAVVVFAILGSGRVSAATDRVDELIRRAIEMRRTGDDQGAQPLFREAYEISHAPRAAAQLGFCEQALGRWVDAETHLGESLRKANDPWVKKNRGVIEEALVLIKSHIGRLEISGEPAGAEVVVNGNAVGQLPLAMPVRVTGGEIEIELRAPGYTTVTKKIRVDGGQYEKLSMRAQKETTAAVVATTGAWPPTAVPQTTGPPPLATADVVTPPATGDDGSASRAGSPEAGTEGPGTLRKSLKFVGWGLAAAALGMGIYRIAQNRSLVAESDSGCGKDAMGVPRVTPDAPPGFTDERCGDLKKRYEAAANLGVGGIVAGVVLAGAGVALWLTEPEADEGRTTAAWRCFPDVSTKGEPSVGCTVRF